MDTVAFRILTDENLKKNKMIFRYANLNKKFFIVTGCKTECMQIKKTSRIVDDAQAIQLAFLYGICHMKIFVENWIQTTGKKKWPPK